MLAKEGKVKSQHSEIIGFSILESTQCMVPHTDLDLPKGLHPSYTLPSQHCSTWLSYQLWHSSKEKQKTEILKAAWKSKYFEFHLNMSENQVEYMLCCCTVQKQIMPYRHAIASRLLHLNEEKWLCNSPLPVYSLSAITATHVINIVLPCHAPVGLGQGCGQWMSQQDSILMKSLEDWHMVKTLHSIQQKDHNKQFNQCLHLRSLCLVNQPGQDKKIELHLSSGQVGLLFSSSNF